jgi:hypothetical protein
MPNKKVARKRKAEETVIPEDLSPLPIKVEESPLTRDLAEADKEEFANLLRKKMTLTERAEMLVKLAGYTDSKRAPVALRAIQEINQITGVKEDKPTEASPLFVLPPNTAVAIKVFEPDE